jgi:Tfp pilus assembly protein PilN
MIQFNLLPDIKVKYIKTQRIKRLVQIISGALAGLALVIFLFLVLYVNVVQKHQLSDLTTENSSEAGQLQNNSNLNDILTIQSQMSALPTLDAQKPQVARLFTYLSELIPVSVTISSLNIDYTQNSITIQGNADSIATINQMVDTLKFTTYTTTNASTGPLAFSGVVLESYGINTGSAAAGTGPSYSINFSFAPAIFMNNNNAKLIVPSQTTTRSILDQPNLPDLFKSDKTTGTQ